MKNADSALCGQQPSRMFRKKKNGCVDWMNFTVGILNGQAKMMEGIFDRACKFTLRRVHAPVVRAQQVKRHLGGLRLC